MILLNVGVQQQTHAPHNRSEQRIDTEPGVESQRQVMTDGADFLHTLPLALRHLNPHV